MDLTLKQANIIIEHALAKGHESHCKPLTVVVLDTGGQFKALAREDGSGILRVEIATGKAWGALGIGLGSRALAKRIQEDPLGAAFVDAIATASGGKVVPVPGGVLVRDDAGALIGAVGISGDTSDNDEACAVAGVQSAGLTADTG
ncbi:MAG: heme-binding protein [Gammaproteobacteria bacterium]|nr:heme-binding protein [Gammaproteobacteria bacterium]NIR83222.1 heme-binding protein [Gammaproteobacteria bacterium]NIR91030.1 heme-binding protein [Gammaproteobacteria bacterium]NIU04387.1 heme-binding protein [Gammaproteobacteria bacterium]NIV52610.1 heme-binding protein [Gammaproteobacteria bacterium]